MPVPMTMVELAAAMNEWMRRFIADPAAFDREFVTVETFKAEGEEPSYGDVCSAYLVKIHGELTAAA